MSAIKRLVIVDDDVLIAAFLEDVCADIGMNVVGVAHEADEARDVILREQPEYVLMDVRLGGSRDGVDVANEVRERMPGVKIIFITGSNEPSTLIRMRSNQPHHVLIKPIVARDLADALV